MKSVKNIFLSLCVSSFCFVRANAEEAPSCTPFRVNNITNCPPIAKSLVTSKLTACTLDLKSIAAYEAGTGDITCKETVRIADKILSYVEGEGVKSTKISKDIKNEISKLKRSGDIQKGVGSVKKLLKKKGLYNKRISGTGTDTVISGGGACSASRTCILWFCGDFGDRTCE